MCRILFCDWPTDQDQYERNTLFELEHLTGYDLVFFDPLNFAISNGLRENEGDLWVAEYASFSEKKFIRFLGLVKNAVSQLRDFLNNGGIWIVRSDIPNSHIKILKKSAVGARIKYTESVTSAFFWLTDFLDRYSFHYGTDYSIRFLDNQNHLYRIFKDIPVKGVQTQNLIPRENAFVIADNGAYAHQPIITRLTYPPSSGELYLIPSFLVEDETEKLVEAFSALWHEKKYGPFSPGWLNPFEKRLRSVNPYTDQLLRLNHEIAGLEQKRQEILERQNRIQQLSNMLYKDGDELLQSIRKALKIIGFQMPDAPSPLAGAGFDIYLRDESGADMVGLVRAEKDSPIPYDAFEEILIRLKGCKRAEKPKCILVGNAPYRDAPNRRPPAFCDDIIHQNIAQEFCLMPTVALFDIVCLILENWEYSQMEVFKESIRSDILGCSGIFEMNMRRYLAATTI